MTIPAELTELLRIKDAPLDAVVYLTTTDLAGHSNVSAHAFTDVVDGEYILLPDLFAQKTKVNLNEHQYGVLSVAWPDAAHPWIVEGPCNIFQWGHPANYRFYALKAGEILAKWGDWEQRESFDSLPEELRPTVVAQRGVIVLKAEKAYRAGA